MAGAAADSKTLPQEGSRWFEGVSLRGAGTLHRVLVWEVLGNTRSDEQEGALTLRNVFFLNKLQGNHVLRG